MCIKIIDRLEDQLQHPTRRNHTLPPSLQVFIALRLYGHGSVLDDTDSGAEPHGVSISSACRATTRVTKALCRIQAEHIKWPLTHEEVRQTQQDFMGLREFPESLGPLIAPMYASMELLLATNKHLSIPINAQEMYFI